MLANNVGYLIRYQIISNAHKKQTHDNKHINKNKRNIRNISLIC